MKDKVPVKLIAKSLSIGIIPIIAVIVILVIVAMYDPMLLMPLLFLGIPVLLVLVPLVAIGYSIYKGRGIQRFTLPIIVGLILFVGSFWIPPTSQFWEQYKNNKLFKEATLESCAEISQKYKKKCYELAVEKAGSFKICEVEDKEVSKLCYQSIYHTIKDAGLCSTIDMKINPRLKGLSFSAADCIGRSTKDKAWLEACQRISQLPEESRKSVMEKANCPMD